MFYLADIKKASEGLTFSQELTLEDSLKERSSDILAASPVTVAGSLRYDQGLYLLDYTMSYQLTLPSSRSLTPVLWGNSQVVNEVFVEEGELLAQGDLVEADLVLILETSYIDVTESVLDNILLNLPSRVLTTEEEEATDLPSGQNWSVLTESQYQALQEQEKAANNPFSALTDLLTDQSEG